MPSVSCSAALAVREPAEPAADQVIDEKQLNRPDDDGEPGRQVEESLQAVAGEISPVSFSPSFSPWRPVRESKIRALLCHRKYRGGNFLGPELNFLRSHTVATTRWQSSRFDTADTVAPSDGPVSSPAPPGAGCAIRPGGQPGSRCARRPAKIFPCPATRAETSWPAGRPPGVTARSAGWRAGTGPGQEPQASSRCRQKLQAVHLSPA